MATSWTDPNLSKLPVKTTYMDQIRNALKLELVRRGKSAAFTDPTLNPGVNSSRALHVQELRNLVWSINGVTDANYTGGAVNMAQTVMRATHIQELRQQVNNLENKPMVAAATDCRDGSCMGLCISCTATCTGSCVNSCATGCNSNCTGTCTGTCTGSCTGGCSSCAGCSSCSGCGPW